MHDRKNSRPFVVIDLEIPVIREKPVHSLIFGEDRLNDLWMDERIKLPFHQHLLYAFTRGDALNIKIRRRRPIDFLLILLEPVDAAVRQSVLVFQDAANP